MAKINVRVDNVKVKEVKIFECKNGNKLKKFNIFIGKYKDNDQFKCINCLYWGDQTIMNGDVISFEGTLDLSHYMTKAGILIVNVDININNLVCNSNSSEATKESADSAFDKLSSQLEVQKEEAFDEIEWFKKEGEK